MEDDDGSDEREEEDFADVNSKSWTPRYLQLMVERKKSKDPASFATAMSAILSSSLKAHTRAVIHSLSLLTNRILSSPEQKRIH